MKFTFKIQSFQTEASGIAQSDDIERKLDEADYAAVSDVRSTHEEVFAKLKKRANG